MKVVIATPEATVFEAEAVQVRVPGAKSPFAMLKSHQPIISSLEPGVVKIDREDGRRVEIEIEGFGLVEQHDDLVSILVASARVKGN